MTLSASSRRSIEGGRRTKPQLSLSGGEPAPPDGRRRALGRRGGNRCGGGRIGLDRELALRADADAGAGLRAEVRRRPAGQSDREEPGRSQRRRRTRGPDQRAAPAPGAPHRQQQRGAEQPVHRLVVGGERQRGAGQERRQQRAAALALARSHHQEAGRRDRGHAEDLGVDPEGVGEATGEHDERGGEQERDPVVVVSGAGSGLPSTPSPPPSAC